MVAEPSLQRFDMCVQRLLRFPVRRASWLEKTFLSEDAYKFVPCLLSTSIRVLRTFLLDLLLLALLEPLGGQRSNVFFSLQSPNVFARQRHTATASAAAAHSAGSF
jgi:hypothetical protein